MDRSLAHRLTALLVAALLLLGWTGEARGQHACPHHDSVPGAAAHASGGGDHAAHGAHAGGSAAAGADHDQDHHGQDRDQAPVADAEHQHDACTCLGSCPSAVGEAFLPDPDAGLRVVPAWVRVARSDDSRVATLLLLPFFLPYGQAPPLLG